jgi:endoglucanase
MKKFRKEVKIGLFLCTTLLTAIGSGMNVKKVEGKTEASSYVDAMEPGWNLGNSFDSIGSETSWGNPIVTKELIVSIKEQGFNSIRIPITWDGHFDVNDIINYKIDDSYFDRLDMVINWALEEGLYVIINMHHDSWKWVNTMDTDEAVLPKFNALWTQIADHYKDYSNKLSFESINEPTFLDVDDNKKIELLNILNRAFYEIVRSSGGNNSTRMLVLPTVYTNDSDNYCKALYEMIEDLQDGNIIATIHYYGFWPFSVNIGGKTTFDEEVKIQLEEAFNRVNKYFVQNGIPVICGEYGLLGFDTNLDTIEPGEVLKYFEYINYYGKQSEITLMLWDNGQHFNRTKFTWTNQKLYELILRSENERSSYGESDRIFINKDTRNSESTIKLTLNGNKFIGVTYKDRLLEVGSDYTYEDDTITFRSDFINGLIKESGDNYGIVGTIHLNFSKGLDWEVYITYYNTPVLVPAQSNSKLLSIPVLFNGNRLSTMEASYVNESGYPGPQNWTSFKQFGEMFSPDYLNNELIINSKFFNECKNGDILLKFHFQSGEIIPYTITKTADEIKEVSWKKELEDSYLSYSKPDNTPLKEEKNSNKDNAVNQGSDTKNTIKEDEQGIHNEVVKESNNSLIGFIIILAVVVSALIVSILKRYKK